MDQMEYWNCFASTGKVKDYLQYRNALENSSDTQIEGSRKYERNSYTDRDDTHGISHERVR